MSQFQTSAYHVPSSTGQCLATGQPIESGADCYAVLIDLTEQELADLQKQSPNHPALALGLKRADISALAWEQGYRPQRTFSYWKTQAPEPNQSQQLFVDNMSLTQLLIHLGESTDPNRLAFRFVLALILLRKKLLRHDGSIQAALQLDGEDQPIERAHWQLTPKLDPRKGPMSKWSPDGPMLVYNPDLTEEQITLVTEQLGEVLQTEL